VERECYKYIGNRMLHKINGYPPEDFCGILTVLRDTLSTLNAMSAALPIFPTTLVVQWNRTSSHGRRRRLGSRCWCRSDCLGDCDSHYGGASVFRSGCRLAHWDSCAVARYCDDICCDGLYDSGDLCLCYNDLRDLEKLISH
jgi:hypothetical protein